MSAPFTCKSTDKNSTIVVLPEKISVAIAKAENVGELQKIKANLSGAIKCAKGRLHEAIGEKVDIKAQMNEAAKLLRRAERRIGELLAMSQPGTRLPEGITRNDSSRFQAIAAIPREKFEAQLEKSNPTQAKLIILGGQYTPQTPETSGYFSVKQWKSLSKEERDAAMLTEGTGKFNSTTRGDELRGIEWAMWSWNPVTGCLHACIYCYARDIANNKFPQGWDPTFLPSRLRMPDNTKVPPEAVENVAYKNVFVGSMTDLFGSWVPKEWIQAVIDQVSAHPEWNFLFLTKFPQRYQEFTFPDNAWLGTTVDRQARVEDAEKAMAAAKAEIKWLSIEPMLTPLHFEKLEIFQWVVMGGASSSTETPEWRVPLEWWLPLHQEAVKLDIHVFHKDHLFRPVREYPGFKPQVIELPPEFEQGKKKKN